MPISGDLQKVFDIVTQEKSNQSTPTEPTIAQLRLSTKTSLNYAGKPADIPYQNNFVTTRDGHQLKIRIYNPDIAEGPTLIFYPGCGYITDAFELNAISCSRIANYAKIKVILASLRLVPESPLLTAINDGYDAAKFLATNSKQFKIDKNQIILGGVSSGAHCAFSVSNMAKNDNDLPIAHQILLNGLFDLSQSNHDYDAFEKVDILSNRKLTSFIIKQFNLKPEQLSSPIFSPIFADATSLPATTIIVAEYDGIRNDSEALYKILTKAHNQVKKIILTGQTHDGINIRGLVSDVCDPAKAIADAIIGNS